MGRVRGWGTRAETEDEGSYNRSHTSPTIVTAFSKIEPTKSPFINNAFEVVLDLTLEQNCQTPIGRQAVKYCPPPSPTPQQAAPCRTCGSLLLVSRLSFSSNVSISQCGCEVVVVAAGPGGRAESTTACSVIECEGGAGGDMQ